MSLASAPRVEMRGGVLAVIVRGTTNQNIDDVFSWVPDDAFGEAKRLSSRSFEVVFRGLSDVNTVLSGLPVNVRMTTAAGAKQFTAQVRLAPVYRKFSGDSEIYVEAPIEPVFAGTPDHPLRYRSTFTTRWPASDATVFSASGGTVPPTRRSSLEWSFDRTFDALAAELDPNDRTIFEARLTGKKRQKRAAVEVKVDGLILTADDPDTAFP
ncbi:MAG TPA: hypothetical protein VM580_22920, partial [Labilithrix sp.]|nr:hypothetical protein [Labilithrix sp.]